MISSLIITYASKIIAATIIILIRHYEKSSIVKHYKNKLNNVLKYWKDGK